MSVTGVGLKNCALGHGCMYLANVDAQIRARSKGERSFDDVVVPMFASKKVKL